MGEGLATGRAGWEDLEPGEPEERTRADRLAKGLPLDDATWSQLLDTAVLAGLQKLEIDALVS